MIEYYSLIKKHLSENNSVFFIFLKNFIFLITLNIVFTICTFDNINKINNNFYLIRTWVPLLLIIVTSQIPAYKEKSKSKLILFLVHFTKNSLLLFILIIANFILHLFLYPNTESYNIFIINICSFVPFICLYSTFFNLLLLENFKNILFSYLILFPLLTPFIIFSNYNGILCSEYSLLYCYSLITLSIIVYLILKNHSKS